MPVEQVSAYVRAGPVRAWTRNCIRSHEDRRPTQPLLPGAERATPSRPRIAENWASPDGEVDAPADLSSVVAGVHPELSGFGSLLFSAGCCHCQERIPWISSSDMAADGASSRIHCQPEELNRGPRLATRRVAYLSASEFGNAGRGPSKLAPKGAMSTTFYQLSP
jgi:hypothetical protein